ncbi:MAG TPA: NUDIX hydrolase [Xanthobacteraceae bacterium]
MTAPADQAKIADTSCCGELTAGKLIGTGFRRYERISFVSGSEPQPAQTRDVLRAGWSVAVLPLDLASEQLVLLRQFRLAAQLASGKGNLIEIVAGHVDAQESAAQAARRECREEIGLVPEPLIELLTYFPSPGMLEEQITLFLGIVDSSTIAERGGMAAEHEVISLMRVSIDTALAALAQRAMHSGPLIIALQWLALNRNRLADIVAGA